MCCRRPGEDVSRFVKEEGGWIGRGSPVAGIQLGKRNSGEARGQYLEAVDED